MLILINNLEDWKTQTYQRTINLNTQFEPIIERPYAEQYETVSGKKKKQKKYKKSTDEITERLYNNKAKTIRRNKYE